MKIVQFTAENVKRLKLVRITPKGHLVPITGRNGQGKTSVLDAIWWALGGKDNVTSVPVRKGAETGTITLDLGDFIVERTFTTKKKCPICKGVDLTVNKPRSVGLSTDPPDIKACDNCGGTGFVAENGTEVTVRAPSAIEGKKGPKYDSPQAMLDALVGSLSFDPLEFARATAAEQFSILRKTVKVDFDFDGMTKANDEDYRERTRVNKGAKEQRAHANSIVIATGLPESRVDDAAIEAELRLAYETNSQRAVKIQATKGEQEKLDERTKLVDKMRSDAADLRARAETLEKNAAELEDSIVKARDVLQKLQPPPEQVDVNEIRQRLDQAKLVNKAIQQREAKAEIIASAERMEAASCEITARMEEREKQKVSAVASARMPVEGLGFGEGFVTFNGLPFEQASDAERLRISMAVAMATNPKLRVLRIRDGSLLDENSMKIIGDMAKDQDFQFWIEKVQTDAPVGIVIEDGEVKADRQVEDAAASV